MAIEKPKRPKAVNSILMNTTTPVDSLLLSLSANKLDNTVPDEIIIVIYPIYERLTPNSLWAIDQIEPNKESGSPKLIKAK